jgi:hypothetical protein
MLSGLRKSLEVRLFSTLNSLDGGKPTSARIPFTETRRRAKVPLMKTVLSSAMGSRSDITPKRDVIQTCIITCSGI